MAKMSYVYCNHLLSLHYEEVSVLTPLILSNGYMDVNNFILFCQKLNISKEKCYDFVFNNLLPQSSPMEPKSGLFALRSVLYCFA